MFTFIKNSSTVLLFCLLGALLQGCGAERDTPFNAGNSNSSDRSLGTYIGNGERLAKGTKPSTTPEDQNKKLLAIRDENEMDDIWTEYVGSTGWNTDIVKFDKGQVLLIDRGQIGECEPLIDFDSIKFYDHSANTVKAVIRYLDSDESNSSSSTSESSSSSSSSSGEYNEPDCDSGVSTPNQPFWFYYVPSRKILVFEEDIE